MVYAGRILMIAPRLIRPIPLGGDRTGAYMGRE